MERDRELILATLLSPNRGSNQLIFHYTPTGNIIVASAYKLAMHHRNIQQGVSSASSPSSAWNLIWDMEVPSKVRHFIWRLYHRALPYKENCGGEEFLALMDVRDVAMAGKMIIISFKIAHMLKLFGNYQVFHCSS